MGSSEPDGSEVVYRLQDDRAAIEAMQRGSLSEGDIGLRITHGLIGSETWWNCIAYGELPLRVATGDVSGFWPGQWGDGPADFELRPLQGAPSRWMCNMEPKPAALAYRLGRAVRVEYVEQERKIAFGGSNRSLIVIRIVLG